MVSCVAAKGMASVGKIPAGLTVNGCCAGAACTQAGTKGSVRVLGQESMRGAAGTSAVKRRGWTGEALNAGPGPAAGAAALSPAGGSGAMRVVLVMRQLASLAFRTVLRAVSLGLMLRSASFPAQFVNASNRRARGAMVAGRYSTILSTCIIAH